MKYHDICSTQIKINGGLLAMSVAMTVHDYFYYFDARYGAVHNSLSALTKQKMIIYKLCTDCYRYYYKQSTKKTCCDDCKKIKKDKI